MSSRLRLPLRDPLLVRRPPGRRGFTLVELLVAILIFLILLAITAAAVGRMAGGDRVRGATRQVQSALSGGRDRAIYAASRQEDPKDIPPATGVRFLVDQATLPDPAAAPSMTNVPRGFNGMVFVQETPPLRTAVRVYHDTVGVGAWWYVSQLNPDGTPVDAIGGAALPQRSLKRLFERGLIPTRFQTVNPINDVPVPDGLQVCYLPIFFDNDASQDTYIVQFVPRPFDASNPNNPLQGSMGGAANNWLQAGKISKPFYNAAFPSGGRAECQFRLLAAPMPSEQPRLLPPGTVVDLASSRIGGFAGSSSLLNAGVLRTDGSFDVMFNARGIVAGPLAAAGTISLVVVDSRDLEAGFGINQQQITLDGALTERRGEENIVSVLTQTGGIYVSGVNPTPTTGDPTLRVNPFYYTTNGGEAK